MKLAGVAPAAGKGALPGAFWLSWLVAAAALATLATLAAAHDYLPGDRGLTQRIQDVDAAAFSEALPWASRFAEIPLLLVVGLGLALALWLLSRRWEAAWLVAALAASWLNGGVKLLVDRPRPSPALVEVAENASGSAFPSGHVTAALLVYGFLFYLAGLLIPDRPWRWLVQASCLVVIGLTAAQRVYAGVHWPSDVLGSLLLGGLILSLLVWSHRRFRFLTPEP